MKKSVILLASCFVFTLSLGLCACGETEEEIAVHGHQAVWTFDKKKHYKICSECGVELEEGEHVGEEFCEICKNYIGFTDGLFFELNAEGTGYILSGCGRASESEIVVPTMYRLLPVLAVKESAFEGSQITSITLREGVTQIGEKAFYNCKRLTLVTLPQSLTTIGESAFESSAVSQITLPQGLETIGEGAFFGCPISQITIPANTKKIGSVAFADCEELKEVTFLGDKIVTFEESLFSGCIGLETFDIPHSVEEIGAIAFKGCENLVRVSFGEKLKKIGLFAFSGCKNLNEFTLPDSLETLDNTAFGGTKFLTDSSNQKNGLYISGSCVLSSDKNISGEVEIPEGVKIIAGSAFLGKDKITAVHFPKSLLRINVDAFIGCGIESAVFSDPEGWKCEGESAPLSLQDAGEAAKVLLQGKYLFKE